MDKQIVKDILIKAINYVKPENLLLEKIRLNNNTLIIGNYTVPLKKYKNIYIAGSGKASFSMLKAIKKILGSKIKKGLIISNTHYEGFENIEVLKGSHPLPNESSLEATKRLCELLKDLNENDFLIYLLSGGSSAFVEQIPDDLKLEDIQEFTDILLKSGMTIEEINTLRKKISLVKGGKLLNYIRSNGICLVLSDVIGDDLRYIGSGPLYAKKDNFTPEKILDKYNLQHNIPKKIKRYLLKPDNFPNKDFPHFIIGNNLDFLKAIQRLLKKKANIHGKILTTFLKGEAKEVAKVVVAIGKFSKGCIILGGESTVIVRGTGKGGRNQEMVLSALSELQNDKNFLFASVASDGIDGNSPAAGAIIGEDTILRAKQLNLDIQNFLKKNDSYTFLKKTNSLIVTGPTGTNVLDATLILWHN